jgi:hypothetical protein
MTATSLTLNYDALLSTTLFNYRRTMADNIGVDNVLLYVLQRSANGWKEVSDIGERAAFPLMYELGSPDSYDGYDQLHIVPMDGMTDAFFDWRQASVAITISGKEEKQNRGEARIINLLEKKIMQAELGLKEWFAKALFQGLGVIDGASITSAYVSPTNGSSFVDPVPLIVAKDPTASVTVGSINQNTNTWWRNKYKSSSASTVAAFRAELRNLYNQCTKGTGGRPDLHITDQTTHELYEQSLEGMVANPSYTKADIPFDTVVFKKRPVAWDERMPDFQTPVAGNCDTKGTWLMLNTEHLGVQVQSETNFAPTPFVKPENQDAKSSHILWLGAFGSNNRRKQGVLFNIARTLT